MKRTILAFAFVILLGTSFFGRRAEAQTPAAPEKTAGEARKNVQVLKDVPDSELENAMWFIAGSLGVPCQHCHTSAFESDAKQSKLTARKMIQMTRELNTANFGGKPVVTCNTCHQGSIKPNGVPNFWGKDNKTPEQVAAYLKERQPGPPPGQPAAPAQPPSNPTATAEPLPDAETVFENYRKAVGITPVTSMHMIADADADTSPQPLHLEIYSDFPDRFEQSVLTPVGKFQQIINGDHGWNVSAGGTNELTPAQITGLKSNLTQGLAPVKYSHSENPRKVTGIEKIGDRSYYVVESRSAKNRTQFFFDIQTGLLYKTHLEVFTPLGMYPADTVFEDYREANGFKVPYSMIVHGTSGGVRYKFSGIQINLPVDASIFNPPPAAAPKQPS